MNNKIDWDFIEKLKNVSDSGEGSLFHNGLTDIEAQLDFIDLVLSEVKPKTILEIGTHKGFFDYYCLLIEPGLKIYTIDVAPWSATATDMVNKKLGVDAITFLHGSSDSILPAFTPKERIDLAYVDGNHSRQACADDLENCYKLGITKILVDDCSLLTQVREATDDFCEKRGFKAIKRSHPNDSRGMIFIEKV